MYRIYFGNIKTCLLCLFLCKGVCVWSLNNTFCLLFPKSTEWRLRKPSLFCEMMPQKNLILNKSLTKQSYFRETRIMEYFTFFLLNLNYHLIALLSLSCWTLRLFPKTKDSTLVNLKKTNTIFSMLGLCTILQPLLLSY